MYIAFGNRIVDSKDFKKLIEDKTEFKVVKDMSKGSKREDVVAFNISIDVDTLKEISEEEYDFSKLSEDELFEEYLTLAEEIATDLEEFIPNDAIFDIRSYKWDKSDNDIKLVFVMSHEEMKENKLEEIIKRLLTQVE